MSLSDHAFIYPQRQAELAHSAWRSPLRHTISAPVAMKGIGAHSGQEVLAQLAPLHEPRGLVLNGAPLNEWRREARWATLLTHPRLGLSVSTPEHLLAALYGAGVDDVEITLSGASSAQGSLELPIFDGSAWPWLRAITPSLTAGGGHLRTWRRLPAIQLERGGASVSTSPSPVSRAEGPLSVQLSVSVGVLYPELLEGLSAERAELLKTPQVAWLLSAVDFTSRIAMARTFGLRRHEAALKARGLIQGVTEDSCLILSDEGEPHRALRIPAELAAHKLLDTLGDLALSGGRWMGHLAVKRGSHALNHALIDALEGLA